MKEKLNSSKLKVYSMCPLKYKHIYYSNISTKINKYEKINLFIHNKVHEVIYTFIENYEKTADIETLEKILKTNWDSTIFSDVNEERETGLEIIRLLKNFSEHYFIYGSTVFLKQPFKFQLEQYSYTGIIEHLVETIGNSYTLILYSTGKKPDENFNIFDDYKIIIQLLFLKAVHNITPESIKIYYLKYNDLTNIMITNENVDLINSGIEKIVNLSYELTNDNNFNFKKSKHCSFCDFIMICPTGKEKNLVNEYSKIIENYFKISEYSNQITKYTFSLKNLLIEFKNILVNIENYKNIKYLILDDNVREFVKNIIDKNDLYNENNNEEKNIDFTKNNMTQVKIDDEFNAYVNIIEINDKPSIVQLIINSDTTTKDNNKFLITLCRFFNSTFQNAYNFKKSITDNLTKLYNNGYYNLKLSDEKKIALNYSKSLGLIVTDIDHFKKFNDTYGHLIGDLVLIEVAKILKSSITSTDWVFRYGGEEFTIIVPNKDLKETKLLAEKIRRNIEKNKISHENHILSVTMSFGVAVYPENTDDIDELFKTADDKLYESKENGRNRVTV